MKWWMRWCGLPRKRWSPSWARPKGFLDPSVTTIDPAMGTGTFLHSIIEHVAENVEKTERPWCSCRNDHRTRLAAHRLRAAARFIRRGRAANHRPLAQLRG